MLGEVMLKWIAILLNIVLLGMVAFLLVFSNAKITAEGYWLLIPIIAAPAVSLWHIHFARPLAQSGDDESILNLWLRVKKTELRKRLD